MTTKLCGKCDRDKPLNAFHKGNGKHNRASYCKECVRAYAKTNRERLRKSEEKWRNGNSDYAKEYYASNQEVRKVQNRQYAAAHREEARERTLTWIKNNPERKKQYDLSRYEQCKAEGRLDEYYGNVDKERNKQRAKRWRKENRFRVLASTAKRRAVKPHATPAWADFNAITELYRKAQQLTETTGIPHQVDHIIPLNSNVVCGLHWENNLQVLTAKENNSKKNRLPAEVA